MDNVPIGFCRISYELNRLYDISQDLILTKRHLDKAIEWLQADIEAGVLTNEEAKRLILYYELEFLAN